MDADFYVRIGDVLYAFGPDGRAVLRPNDENAKDIYALSFVDPRCPETVEWATVIDDASLVIKTADKYFVARFEASSLRYGNLELWNPLIDDTIQKAEAQIQELQQEHGETAKLMGVDFVWPGPRSSAGNLAAHGSHALAASG